MCVFGVVRLMSVSSLMQKSVAGQLVEPVGVFALHPYARRRRAREAEIGLDKWSHVSMRKDLPLGRSA